MPAMNYYRQAENHALNANELASDAREKLTKYKEIHATIKRWDQIMANTHPVVWAIFFVIISVIEYLFSIELYTDLLPLTPWIIPIGIIVISVFISHGLATRLMPSLRNKEFSDKKHSDLFKDKTDEQIWNDVHKTSNRNLIYGIIGAVIITGFIFFLSKERVERQLAAGIGVKPFGVYDMWPVIFYIFEIIAGVLVLYLIKRTFRGITAYRLKKRFDKLVRLVAQETDNAIRSFETSEANGLDLLQHPISESIHIAFYRNKNCNPSDEENYIKEPQNLQTFVKFQLIRSDKAKPLMANVHVYSEYNYAGVSASDDTGLVEIPFSSFENDTIKKVVVEFSDNMNTEDTVIYKTGNDTPHRILFRE